MSDAINTIAHSRRATDILAGGLIGLTLALMPFIAMGGGLGLAPAGVLIGITGWIYLYQDKAIKGFVTRSWILAMLALIGWILLAQFWSPYKSPIWPSNALRVSAGLLLYCGILTAFKYLSAENQDLLAHLFMAGSVLAAGLMLIDVLNNYGLSIFFDPVDINQILPRRQFDAEQNIGRGLLVYTQCLPILFFLFLAYFKKGWLYFLLLTGVIIAACHYNHLKLPIIIIFVTAPVMLLSWYFPKFTLRLICAGIILMILGGPIIGWVLGFYNVEQFEIFPLSLEHRFRMWIYCWDIIVQHPIIGDGFDASRSYDDTFRARDFMDISIVSLHPHNASVQIWVELGAIGAVLSGLIMFCLIPSVIAFASDRRRASALAGIMTMFCLFGFTTIGIWQVWWLGSIFLILSFLNFIPKTPKDDKVF